MKTIMTICIILMAANASAACTREIVCAGGNCHGETVCR